MNQISHLDAAERLDDVEMLLAGTGKLAKSDHRSYLRQLQIRATEGQEAPKPRPSSPEALRAMAEGKIGVVMEPPKPKVRPKRKSNA